MAYQCLVTERVGPVERLLLNRPGVRNAFNAEMIAELSHWAAEFQHRPASDRARVVVLGGAGKAFCAGADAAWLAKIASHSEEENIRDATAASQMFRALNELPVPLVGRIHGAAIGGSAGLAAVCDIVVSTEEALFGFPEVRLGIIPAVISPFVLAKIGASAARELFLTGVRFSAARAYALNLVHVVVAVADIDETVERYVAEILAGGPEAMAATKAVIRDVSRGGGEDVTAKALAARRASPEGREGLRAFLEKRKPRWSP